MNRERASPDHYETQKVDLVVHGFLVHIFSFCEACLYILSLSFMSNQWNQLLGTKCVHVFPTLHLVASCSWLEIDYGGSIYTMELIKCYGCGIESYL